MEMLKLELITRRPTTDARPIPLLFVHGAWHGAWCWDEHFLPFFAEHGYTAHAMSLRGHGKSDGANSLLRASISDYVLDVAGVAAHFMTPPVVIGHSMGGLVVQKYLERYSAPAAVLMAPIPINGTIPFSLKLAWRHPLAMFKAAITLNPQHVLGKPGLARDAMFSDDMPDEKVEEYAARLQRESIRVLFDSALLDLPDPRKIKAPMLILGAEKDRIFSVDEIHETAQAYKAEAEIFPMAHDMMLEFGWEQVAGRILEWLQTQGI